jgi:hypothetical protein
MNFASNQHPRTYFNIDSVLRRYHSSDYPARTCLEIEPQQKKLTPVKSLVLFVPDRFHRRKNFSRSAANIFRSDVRFLKIFNRMLGSKRAEYA